MLRYQCTIDSMSAHWNDYMFWYTCMKNEVDNANNMAEQQESTNSVAGPMFSGRNLISGRRRGVIISHPFSLGRTCEGWMHSLPPDLQCQLHTPVALAISAKVAGQVQHRDLKRPTQEKLQILPSSQKSTIHASLGFVSFSLMHSPLRFSKSLMFLFFLCGSCMTIITDYMNHLWT